VFVELVRAGKELPEFASLMTSESENRDDDSPDVCPSCKAASLLLMRDPRPHNPIPGLLAKNLDA